MLDLFVALIASASFALFVRGCHYSCEDYLIMSSGYHTAIVTEFTGTTRLVGTIRIVDARERSYLFAMK